MTTSSPTTLITIAIIFAALLNIVKSIDLTANKPRVQKNTSKPTILAATSEPASLSTYRVNGTDGTTCILIITDALLSIMYRDKLNEAKEANLFLPDYPELSGDCPDRDQSSITLGFKGFILTIEFQKTPGREQWYVSNMELTYSTSNKIFEHIDRPGLDVKLTSKGHSSKMFPTPVGKSYTCDQEQIITMYSEDENDKSGHLAKLYLRELKMQSFMFKASNAFGPTFQCSATGTYRSEMAPLAVGSTLAVAVLLSITAYGVWRYMKIKNVQYGAME